MNLTIILSSLFALIAGLAGGAAYTKQNTELSPTETLTPTAEEAMIIPEDFVSVRPALASLPTEALTDEEKQDLLYMREEEKLARDVYQTLYEKWNMPIFTNIAQSEQTHTEAVLNLINKYNLTDPVTNDAIGEFQNEELQNLYDQLTQTGLTSETEALKVGVAIEELDIKDLADAIARTDNADIALVYENLQRGSRNHLRSFNKQLVARGVTYVPTSISTDEYERITSGSTERGSESQRGQGGAGRGWGGR